MSEQAFRPTELRISAEAIADNVRAIKRRLMRRARMMAIVKADAYGHGAVDVSNIALKNGADMLGVALVEEGVQLRDAGVTAPILVLGGVTDAGARAIVRYNLTCALYDGHTLDILQNEAEKRGMIAHAHMKIDTGMRRVGLIGDDAVSDMLSKLRGAPRVKLEGVFTHFACADCDPEFTRRQNAEFLRTVARIREAGHTVLAHASSSAACLTDETLWYDMVRPGIALYGAEVRHLCPELRPAQTLVSMPARIEWIEPGDSVGYGATYRATRKTRVATIPIGYGDGYPRCLSNRAAALLRGVRCPVIGRVCMDMLMLDVTNVPDARLSDPVVLLGAQGDEIITPDELAALAGSIPYEIMLGFSSRVPRRLVRHG